VSGGPPAEDRTARFFRPAWRRAAVVLVCLIWSGVEWANGQAVWGILALAMAGWAVWTFFINYKPGDEA
jgi:hypothetical protein